MIDSINSVEDTKGNNGEKGQLQVTNLRVIWISHRLSHTNLSIGYNCVSNISIKAVKSRLKGSTQALYVLTKFQNSRFEFIFTSLVKNSPRLFTTVQAVLRAYETTKLYRELKLRGSVIRNQELILLPHEQVYDKIPGAWNLSADQGNLGTFFITNVRVVWHANMAENFNVSIPYQQLKSCRKRESKFGPAMVLETNAKAGGYILGFRIDPVEKLADTLSQVKSMHEIFSENPIFGVEFEHEEQTPALEQVTVPRTEDDIEIISTQEATGSDALAIYYAQAQKVCDRDVIYNPTLGLAVESLPQETTLEQLWNVI